MICRFFTAMSVVLCVLASPHMVAGDPVSEGAAPALQDARQTSAVRIHIAGRQRMLTQRMTKSMCFAMLGIQQAAHAQRAEDAAVEFETQLAVLQNDPTAKGGRPAGKPEIRAKLRDVAALSSGFTASVRQISAGDMHAFALDLVLNRNLAVLKTMNDAVQKMVAQSGSTLPPKIASTLNEAGRERMLSQRMAKDVCLIAAGLNTVKSRVALKHDVIYFGSVHSALSSQGSDTHFEVAPTAEIRTALRGVGALWLLLEPQVQEVIAGADPDPQMLHAIAELSEGILHRMNEAVVLWARHHS